MKLLQIRRMRHCCLERSDSFESGTPCVGGLNRTVSFTTTEEAAKRDKNYSLMNLAATRASDFPIEKYDFHED